MGKINSSGNRVALLINGRSAFKKRLSWVQFQPVAAPGPINCIP
jgi:hypothetical protein